MNGTTALLDGSLARLLDLAGRIEKNECPVIETSVGGHTDPQPDPPVPAGIVVPVEVDVVCLELEPVEAHVAVEAALVSVEPEPVDIEIDIASVGASPQEPPSSALRTEDMSRLEILRTEINELAGRRMGRRNRLRYENARQEEREILARLGYDSYLQLIIMKAEGRQSR